ncbi:hypothetical protein MMC30_002310 [Trapelia coarctata]|nr:hypothetical protein [Trapelia coarctata]
MSPALSAKSPPMSKYFQTPTSGWNSSNRPPNPNDSGATGSTESLPSLPARPLHSPPPVEISQHPPNGPQPYSPTALQSAPSIDQSKVPPYNPQDYAPSRNGPNSPVGPPRVQGVHLANQSDTSKWGVKYNHGYSRSQDNRPKPALPPRPKASSQDDFNHHHAPSKLAPKDEQEGYKLRPIAYDPNPPPDDDEQRQSWQEGDDLQSMQPSAPLNPPPKPPKIPKEGRSDVLHAAPQLPPLYFESQPAVIQQDFAYSRPPGHTNIQITAPPPNRDQDHDIPRSDSVTILPVPFPPARPSAPGPTDHRARRISKPLQPAQQQPSRKSGSNPVNVVAAQHHSSESSTDRSDRSAAVRRDTGEGKPRRQSQTIQIPQQPRAALDNDTQDANNSFYFHSPQSSTDEALDEGPEASATKEGPLLSSKTITSEYGLSSASALGFGGPSDWEHFGDYDAEEIDDEDLYVSTKPKTAELPAVTSPVEVPSSQPISTSVNPEAKTSTIIPSAEHTQNDQAAIEPQPSPAAEAQMEKPQDSRDTVVAEEQPITRTPPPPSLPLLFESSPDKPLLESCEDQAVHIESSEDNKPPSHVETDTHIQDPVHPAEDNQDGPLSSNVGGSTEDLQSTEAHELDKDKASAEGAPTMIVDSGVQQDEDRDHGARTESPPHSAGHGQEKTETEIGVSPKGADNQVDGSTTSDNNRIGEGNQHTSVGNDDEVGEDIIISLEMPDSRRESLNEPRPQENSSLDRGTTNLLSPMPRGPLESGRSDRRSVFPNSVELEDPYANLDAWAKASLNRYVKMLREESSAEEDEQKYMIFTNFTRRETRLRAVLYDMDDDLEPVEQPPAIKRTLLKGSTSILTLRPSIKSKALPALPPGAQGPLPSQAKEQPKKLETPLRPLEKVQEPVEPEAKSDRPKLTQLDVQGSTLRGSSEESYVMVESPSDQQYTPGGRPVIAPIVHDKSASPLKGTPSLTSLRQALEVVGSRLGGGSSKDSRSPGANTPSGSTETVSSVRPPEAPRSNSVPLPPVPDSGIEKIAVGTDKPAYTPMKYNEGRPYEGDKASNRQSIYTPFAGLLRESSQRHGSLYNGFDNHKRASARASIASNQTHPDSLETGKRRSQLTKSTTQAPNQRYSILDPLLEVVPPSSVLRPEPVQTIRMRQQVESIPDDFAFIHETVLAWHTETKQKQELHDRERHARQGESEQRIDALFNDHEIGYGDISELEVEFKRTEASKKAEEDRAEYQSFVKNVFEVVWARLHYEMDQLTPLYDICTQMLNDATAGKEMFDDAGDRVPVAPAMDTLLTLYQKLGVRHQKAFEAVLERDRRLKKTEVAPWYALGEVGKVKKLEKRFEEAEKKAILDFCRQRDERANLLMDVLDQNTLRGVGSNQDYMESVMQAVRKIALDIALGALDDSHPLPPTEVLKAQSITSALARSSEQIVQTFHVADMLLNAADYEVSVANARLANADADAFKRLREAKAKEDAKLVKDLEHRMNLIRGDTARTQDEIGKVLALMGGVEGGSAGRRGSAPVEGEREGRLRVALEEAKRRNKAKGKDGAAVV